MDKHLFGPVPSRRLGISLGVDIIPFKTCSLDCIYCECGRTTNHTIKRQRFFSPDIIKDEMEEFLKDNVHLDYITFSGSGEPTLNCDIGALIKDIKKKTNTPVAVLTNGTLLYDKNVREDLAEADLILPSLDAISENVFKKINRPAEGLDTEKMIRGLSEFRKIYKGDIWLEVFISHGINDSEEELLKLYETIKKIGPERVQLNSLDRPPAYKGAEPVNIKFLEKIKKNWSDLAVEIIKRTKIREEISSFSKNLENSIINTINRRPLTLEDLMSLTGKSRLELLKYIDVLEKDKKIEPKIVEDKIFYSPV
ncbi:MAG: radical SAM protein [Acidobacteriota bacterium]